MAGVIDREDGVDEGAIGDLSGFSEAVGVGGVGEVDVVEGVAFACGTIGVWRPGGVERRRLRSPVGIRVARSMPIVFNCWTIGSMRRSQSWRVVDSIVSNQVVRSV